MRGGEGEARCFASTREARVRTQLRLEEGEARVDGDPFSPPAPSFVLARGMDPQSCDSHLTETRTGKVCDRAASSCPGPRSQRQELLSPVATSPYIRHIAAEGTACGLWPWVPAPLQGQARRQEAHIQPRARGLGLLGALPNLVRSLFGAQPKCGTDVLIQLFFSTDFFFLMKSS